MKWTWLSTIVFIFACGCATRAKAPSPPVSAEAERGPEVHVTQTAATPTAEAHEPQTTCVHESDTRVLQLQARGGGCNLNYTKYGKTASVVKSANGTDACEKVEQKIRAKLESVGYSCR